MRLEDIGFYTLSDYRASQASAQSPLWRCELILTSACNFKCPYCRGLRSDISGKLPFDNAMQTLKLWVAQGLRNIRFSGGEPTLYPELSTLIKYCKENKVERIAISTNGSADPDYYKYLIDCGVNDISISLDSGCCSIGDKMTGSINGAWDSVVHSIKRISRICYVTVGVVFTEDNFSDTMNTVLFADSLGVSDIRVIPAAQYGKALKVLEGLPQWILNKYPILRYRVEQSRKNLPVRGLPKPCSKCWLVLDDIAAAGGYHFPCIIYMRESGDPIGKVGPQMREEREQWMLKHDPAQDKICSEMCLDVCVEHNNKVEQFRAQR